MNVVKKYQFWLCLLLGGALFAGLWPLSVSPYHGAYYTLLFNALTIVGVCVLLYWAWVKDLTKPHIRKLLVYFMVTALPHAVLSMMSYGSWVCLGGSLVVVLALLSKKKNPDKAPAAAKKKDPSAPAKKKKKKK